MGLSSYIVKDTRLAISVPLASISGILPEKSSLIKSIKRGAFTLAEVLITLTVIGVIAAMTIPTLMTEYRKQTYVTGLKKAYSELSNAIRMLPLSENCSAGDMECAGWEEYPVLDIEGQSFNGNISHKRAYLLSKQFKDSELIYDGTSRKVKVLNENYSYDFIPALRLADGVIIDTTGLFGSSIGVDLNGIKGPNTMGRDIFYFTVTGHTNNWSNIPTGLVLPAGSKQFSEYAGFNDGYLYWRNSTAWEDKHAAQVLEEGKMNY